MHQHQDLSLSQINLSVWHFLQIEEEEEDNGPITTPRTSNDVRTHGRTSSRYLLSTFKSISLDIRHHRPLHFFILSHLIEEMWDYINYSSFWLTQDLSMWHPYPSSNDLDWQMKCPRWDTHPPLPCPTQDLRNRYRIHPEKSTHGMIKFIIHLFNALREWHFFF